MDTSNESIIMALMVLREVCAEREDCGGCPLRDLDGFKCELRKTWPKYWQINAADEMWRAFRA